MMFPGLMWDDWTLKDDLTWEASFSQEEEEQAACEAPHHLNSTHRRGGQNMLVYMFYFTVCTFIKNWQILTLQEFSCKIQIQNKGEAAVNTQDLQCCCFTVSSYQWRIVKYFNRVSHIVKKNHLCMKPMFYDVSSVVNLTFLKLLFHFWRSLLF